MLTVPASTPASRGSAARHPALLGFLLVLLVAVACSSSGGSCSPGPGHASEDRDATSIEDLSGEGELSDAGEGECEPSQDGSDGGCDLQPRGLPELLIEVDPEELARIYAEPKERIEVMSTVEVDGLLYHEVEFELHGGLARRFDKKSFRLKFPDPDGTLLDLLGRGPEPTHRIVLQACWVDTTFVRNWLTMDLVRELGGLAPRLGFATVTLNREHLGLYSTIERIDKQYLERQGLSPRGNLYKAENHYANWSPGDNALTGFRKVINEDGQAEDLLDFLGVLARTPANHAAFQEHVEPLLHIEDFLVWHLVHSFAMNHDTFTKNFYFYHDTEAAPSTPEARFRIISWDADATFGNNWDGKPLDPTEDWWHGGNVFSPRFFSIPEYCRAYLERFRELLVSGPMRAGALRARARRLRTLIREEAAWDLDHWERGADFEAEMDRLNEVFVLRQQTMLRVVEDELGAR